MWKKPLGGYSDKDFLAKLTVAYKEARETHYWIKLLRDTGYIEPKQAESLLTDLDEILKIIGSIQKTIKYKTSQ
jgi:four helix bundle protein